MDPFDVPEIIPSRPDGASRQSAPEAPSPGWINQPVRTVLEAWHEAAQRRTAARTPEARESVMAANRAHRDSMRDLRRDQRAFEKARDEVSWWNVFNGERRAAAAVVRDTRTLARETRNGRRAARRAYPLSMPAFAARCHALHVGPALLWSAVADTVASNATLVASLSVVLGNVAVAVFSVPADATPAENCDTGALQPSQAEAELLRRLDPKVWPTVAGPRGLDDVISAGARLTPSGIQAKFTLNGTMDVPTLSRKLPQVRAALRLAEGTRIELREGSTGGHARLTLRTRSQADGMDLSGWKPGDAWAVNTVTGETVPVPLGKRLLIAGTSGSGKSWSARPLMAEASEPEDHRLVVVDRKYTEARNWEHRARTACELEEIDALCDELTEEGEERLKTIPRGRDVIEISPSRPRITVFVDEGGELIQDCKKDFAHLMDRFRTIARKYRAAEIILVWATQKPSLSGEGHGIDSQIAGQMVDRLSLATATPTEARVVFGDDAAERGWKSNELPMPGFALYRRQDLGPKCVPQMLQLRRMSPAQVIALPDRPIWSRTVSSTGATAADIEARKELESTGLKTRMPAADRDEQILAELRRDPCRSLSSLSKSTGASKSVLKRRLDHLESIGRVVKDDADCWHPAL